MAYLLWQVRRINEARRHISHGIFVSPEKILIKMRAKTPGNGIAGRRGEF